MDKQEFLSNLKINDKVIRMFSGNVKMPMIVTKITDTQIHCGLWQFDKNTGGEIDLELGWDGITTTGSILKDAIQ